jgi:hypothetical protein
LAAEIGTKHDFETQIKGTCTFYGRDRDESDTQARYFDNFEDYTTNHQTEEYEYILRKDGEWYVDQGNGFELLSEVLVKEAV